MEVGVRTISLCSINSLRLRLSGSRLRQHRCETEGWASPPRLYLSTLRTFPDHQAPGQVNRTVRAQTLASLAATWPSRWMDSHIAAYTPAVQRQTRQLLGNAGEDELRTLSNPDSLHPKTGGSRA